MSNIVSERDIRKAVALAQNYLCNEDFEEGINTTILRDEANRIEIDVELRCNTSSVIFDKGTYLIPPSVSGRITNEPVSIIAWFFDEDMDNPTDRDITKMIESHSYTC